MTREEAIECIGCKIQKYPSNLAEQEAKGMDEYKEQSLDELMERANRLATPVYVKGMEYK